jgi:hypothetical protein
LCAGSAQRRADIPDELPEAAIGDPDHKPLYSRDPSPPRFRQSPKSSPVPRTSLLGECFIDYDRR